MLRMVLLGLLIPLGVGVLAAMELRTPPRTAAAVVQPHAETTVGNSNSHGALAKADRLEGPEDYQPPSARSQILELDLLGALQICMAEQS